MATVKFIGETEIVPKKARRAPGRGRGFGPIFGRARRVFAFLFISTVFIFAFCHRADLQGYIFSKIYKLSQGETQSNTIRQNAINHENEVNKVLEPSNNSH